MAKKSPNSSKTAPNSAKNAPKPPQQPLDSSKPQEQAPRAHRKSPPVWALLTALVLVVGGGILFIFAVSGWFSDKTVILDSEYYSETSSLENSDGDFVELLTVDRYNELANGQKSFLLFVDQDNCVVANRLRDYIKQYTAETGVKPLRIMFADVKNTSLHDQIKYYPSVVIVKNGQLVKYLDPSADDDADEFNDYNAFKTWLDETLAKPEKAMPSAS